MAGRPQSIEGLSTSFALSSCFVAFPHSHPPCSPVWGYSTLIARSRSSTSTSTAWTLVTPVTRPFYLEARIFPYPASRTRKLLLSHHYTSRSSLLSTRPKRRSIRVSSENSSQLPTVSLPACSSFLYHQSRASLTSPDLERESDRYARRTARSSPTRQQTPHSLLRRRQTRRDASRGRRARRRLSLRSCESSRLSSFTSRSAAHSRPARIGPPTMLYTSARPSR